MTEVLDFILGLSLIDYITLVVFLTIVAFTYKTSKAIPLYIENKINSIIQQEKLDISNQLIVTTKLEDITDTIKIYNSKRDNVLDIFVMKFNLNNENDHINGSTKITMETSTLADMSSINTSFTYDFFASCIDTLINDNYLIYDVNNTDLLGVLFFKKKFPDAKYVLFHILRNSDHLPIGFMIFTLNKKIDNTSLRAICNFSGFISFKLDILLRQYFLNYTNNVSTILNNNNINIWAVLKSILMKR
jgi:hypothetical protein